MPKIMFRPNPVPPPFPPPVPVDGPLTFTAREANSSVAFNIEGFIQDVSLSYSIDNGQNWNQYNFGQSVNLAAEGDSVMFKGDNSSFSEGFFNFIQVEMTGMVAASGSLAYLLDSKGGIKALTSYCFIKLFSGCTSLVQAPALPATSLAEDCYSNMFSGCTSLVKAPALPATSLAARCYSYMFSDCTSLVQAPALPATSLAEECYSYMFSICTLLVQAPALPATSLAVDCYVGMFSECTSLVQAPALPATSLAARCYSYMFSDCTSLVQAPALPATSLAEECYSYMFSVCTSLVQAPALPATSLAARCYSYMFGECTLLNYVQCNAIDISAEDCLIGWLSNVSTSGLFKKNPFMNVWPSGADGIPEGWTIENI